MTTDATQQDTVQAVIDEATTGSGFEADCHKYNRAAVEGWKVLRFTTTMVQEGAVETILAALRREPE